MNNTTTTRSIIQKKLRNILFCSYYKNDQGSQQQHEAQSVTADIIKQDIIKAVAHSSEPLLSTIILLPATALWVIRDAFLDECLGHSMLRGTSEHHCALPDF